MLVNHLKGLFVLALLLAIGAAVSLTPIAQAVEPSGGTPTEIGSERIPADAPGTHGAFAGNVTNMDIYGRSVTQTWQAYYGNVTGVITLGDGAGNEIYNWSLASPRGEVYASTNSSFNWIQVQCLNFTATGTYADDTANAGDTSLFGTNLSLLEGEFGISEEDVDGVDETFDLIGSGGHPLFYTANLDFSANECQSTQLYDSTGTRNNVFHNVLLYEPDSASVIFASVLEQDQAGFDSATHDYQMLVLENGHGTDTAVTTNYFFVELE